MKKELRKRGLETHFPREEQRLLFKLFDKVHSLRNLDGPKYLNLELNEDEIKQAIDMCPRSTKNKTIDCYQFVNS
jgi:hypothetical protein